MNIEQVIHSCILAWRIPWTEEPGKLQSTGSHRVRHNWGNLACTHTWTSNHWIQFNWAPSLEPTKFLAHSECIVFIAECITWMIFYWIPKLVPTWSDCLFPKALFLLFLTERRILVLLYPFLMPLLLAAAAATAAKSLQSCPTLCEPIDGSPPGSPIPGILQARTLEWVAISFSNTWKWKVRGKSLSHVRLFATPWTAAYQAPPPMGFSRQEYWSGVPLPSPYSLSLTI